MTNYALYNNSRKVFLKHPTVGIWFSPDLQEAKDMKEAACLYLNQIGLTELVPHIVIVDYATKKEIA